MLTSMIFSLLAVVLLILFMFYKRNFFARQLPGIHPQVTELQQQLEQTADEVIARMENQIAHLEYLLEAADEKIAKLQELAQTSESDHTGTGQEVGIVTNLPELPIKPPLFQPVVLPPELPELVLKTVQVGGDDSEVQDRSSADDKKRLILAMAEQGYNITEIAKATGKGKGEIMLILQLHKK